MQKLRKHIALLLLAVFGFIATPHEFLHSFTDHMDSCDASIHSNTTEGDVISNLHQHCDILELAAPTLYHHIDNYAFYYSRLSAIFQIDNTESYCLFHSSYFHLRGPPTRI